jgi:hypothetical protein
MAGTKMYCFEPESLVRLLTHYTDGLVPLDAQVTNVGFNPYLGRMIGIEVQSSEWDNFEPLHIRYEGSKIMSWVKGTGVDKPIWSETPDTPRRQ